MKINTDIITEYLLLDELTCNELKQYAKKIGIKYVNRKSKKQIVEEIEKIMSIG